MGKLKDLEKKWFVATTECSTDERTTIKPENLTLHSFWGLYVVYGAISIICFMLFIIRLVNNFRCRQGMYDGNITPSNRGVWDTVINLAKYFYSGKETNYTPERAPDFAQAQEAVEWTSSRWDYVSPSVTSENPQASPPNEQIEMLQTHFQD